MTAASLVFDTSVKIALIAAVAWVGTRRAGLADARHAHRLWLAVAAAFVLLPLLSWRVPAAIGLVPSAAVTKRLPAMPGGVPAGLVIASAAVTALLLARVAAGLAGVRRLVARSIPVEEAADGAARRLTAACASAGARLVESAIVTAPATVGALDRLVILPQGWRELDVDALDAAVRHELAHVARRDYVAAVAVEVVCAVWWWHPVVWIARRNVRWFAELACDADASHTGPDVYAEALVSLARARGPAAPRLVLSAASQLRRRVDLLLERGAAANRRVLVAGACAGVVMTALLTVRFAPRGAVPATAGSAHASVHAANHAAHQHPH